ncbi:uncharacterized protein [Amphiura filiformis]|uniref:uncharacterized protein isoform X1 n=1 Tax=Amphiura filiformis TaxID=82378 RepID=UPI003B20DBF0
MNTLQKANMDGTPTVTTLGQKSNYQYSWTEISLDKDTGDIYWSVYDRGDIYRVTPSGIITTVVNRGWSNGASVVFNSPDTLFWTQYSPDNIIFTSDKDGQNEATFYTQTGYHNADQLTLYKDEIYFIQAGYPAGRRIYHMKTDGSQSTPVQDTTVTFAPSCLHIYDNSVPRGTIASEITEKPTPTPAKKSTLSTEGTTVKPTSTSALKSTLSNVLPRTDVTKQRTKTITALSPTKESVQSDDSGTQSTLSKTNPTPKADATSLDDKSLSSIQIVIIAICSFVVIIIVIIIIILVMKRSACEKDVPVENGVNGITALDSPMYAAVADDVFTFANQGPPPQKQNNNNNNEPIELQGDYMDMKGNIKNTGIQGVHEASYANTQTFRPVQETEHDYDDPPISGRYHNNGVSYINTSQHGGPEVMSQERRSVDVITQAAKKNTYARSEDVGNVNRRMTHQDDDIKGKTTANETSTESEQPRLDSGEYDEHHLWQHLVADGQCISFEFVRDEEQDDN